VQVKALRHSATNYIAIAKHKMDPRDECRLVCFLLFRGQALPEVYVIPAAAWLQPNCAFRDYAAEWGIDYTNKSKPIFEAYRIEEAIAKLGA